MTTRLIISSDLHRPFQEHLNTRLEEIGFFLADYKGSDRSLTLREWRPIPADALESRSGFHLTLRDEARAEVIKWAWDNQACLVEAHSHRAGKPAAFSPSDVSGLDQWVPRVWWRLRARPYAAIVVAGTTFDALAWIDSPDSAQQVEHLAVDGEVLIPTGLTLPHLTALREWATHE